VEVIGMRRMVVVVGLVTAAFLFLPLAPAGAGGGSCDSHETTDATGTSVQMSGACFGPTVLRTKPGAEVTWTNRDSFAHVLVGTGWGDVGEVASGESVSFRFEKPGVYAYSCYYHPGMNGVVVVGNGGVPQGSVAEVIPLAADPPAPPPADPQPEPAAPLDADEGATASASVDGEPAAPWRIAALVAFTMFTVTGAAFAVQWWRLRRARMGVQAG
jgi:plastocyanin